jgi:hypothetical protein
LPRLPMVRFPSTGIARRSPGRAHWRTPLRGLPFSTPSSSLLSHALSSPWHHEPLARLFGPHRGPHQPPC